MLIRKERRNVVCSISVQSRVHRGCLFSDLDCLENIQRYTDSYEENGYPSVIPACTHSSTVELSEGAIVITRYGIWERLDIGSIKQVLKADMFGCATV